MRYTSVYFPSLNDPKTTSTLPDDDKHGILGGGCTWNGNENKFITECISEIWILTDKKIYILGSKVVILEVEEPTT